MKKDNKLMKFTSFVLLVTMIALILVAGTFAKYTSEASGSDTAIVAKWSFKVNGKDITLAENNQEITFELFKTIEEENGGEELDVLMEEETGKVIRIAPGTSGKFDMIVENTSQVSAEYTISFTVTDEAGNELTEENSIPLEYTVDGENWYDNLESISEVLLIGSGPQTKTVQWKWPFEKTTTDYEGNEVVDTGYDAHDTSLGINPSTIMVKATIIAEQYDEYELPPDVDWDVYADTPVSLGNAYVSTLQDDATYMSISENMNFNASTAIRLKDAENYTLCIYNQGSRRIKVSDSEEDILYGSGSSIITEYSDWYGVAIKSNSGEFDADASTRLGDYVEFEYPAEETPVVDIDTYNNYILKLGNDYQTTENTMDWASISEDIYLTTDYTVSLNADYEELVLYIYKVNDDGTYTQVEESGIYTWTSVNIPEDGIYKIAFFDLMTGNMTWVEESDVPLSQMITFSN